MHKEPLIWMTAVGAVGYVVFHGHPANSDCFLCPYRGWAFAGGAVVAGVAMAVSE